MKYFLTTLLLLLFTQFNVKAQRNSVFQPVQEDNAYTPYQRNVPYEFRFLVDEKLTRSLFNPANLTLIDSSQAYVTIEPGSNRNYRFAYLSGKGWMLNGSFRNMYNENYVTRSFTSSATETTINNNLRNEYEAYREQLDQDNSLDETNIAELHFSKLLDLENGKSNAFGIYLSFNRSIDNLERDDSGIVEENDQTFRNDTLIINRDYSAEDRSFSSSKRNSEKFQIGIEYSHISENFQGKHKVYTQLNSIDEFDNNLSIGIDEHTIEYFEDTTSTNRYNQFIRRGEINYAYTPYPYIVGYQGYLNRRMNWLGDDYIFSSINTMYGSGEVDLAFTQIEERVRILDGVSQSQPQTDISINAPKKKEYQFNANLTFGYTFSVNVEDLRFFTGITQSLQYIQHESFIVNGNTGVVKFNDNYHTANTVIPLFAEYQVTEWLSFFGGSSMSFTYSISQLRENIDTPIENETSLSNPDKFTHKATTHRFQDQTTTYFGLKASHKSGLKLMADINGDLTRLSGWYLTIGYQF